jgi:peptidoglycan lytic transglycosylase
MRVRPLPLAVLLLAACHRAPPPQAPTPAAPVPKPAEGATPVIFEEGIASWYGRSFDGRATASGEIFDSGAMTAAHRELPFGTLVRVINVQTGAEVVVRINDRGPHVRGRIIDVSRAAADSLGMVRAGTAKVRLILVPPHNDTDRQDTPGIGRIG